MKKIPFTYFWPFHCYDKRVQQTALEQFAEAGVDGVCFNPPEMAAMMGNPGEILRWKKMLSESGVSFLDAHDPYGPLEDLSCPVPELFPHMVRMHAHCLHLCQEFGIKSCTIHVGRPTDYCKDNALLHANLLRALEQLLPTAEECGVVICIENIWDPNNTTSWKNNGFPAGPTEWSDTGDYLKRLLPHIVTCHLHTNDRIRDRHWLPTDKRGKTDWAAEMPLLLSAPRMMQLQNEASPRAENSFTIKQHVESLMAIAALG